MTALAAPTSATARAAPAVELRGTALTYPDGTRALQAISMEVGQGDFVTLLGPSGCGKSTLLRMVAGLLRPSTGEVDLWGRPVVDVESTQRRIAFVFQAPTLMPWSDVATNVRLPLALAGVERQEMHARVQAALRLVGLEQFGHALPRSLSGGMQMRVSIARALVVRPQLLLMDEPFAALDEITRQRLDDDLLALWRSQDLTVLYVTHSISEAVYLSRRVAVMAARPGRLIREVAIDEPYPRAPSFLMSPRFAGYAQRLQEALWEASAT
jgi:NitT/TauT family transport system ATP-binding protein